MFIGFRRSGSAAAQSCACSRALPRRKYSGHSDVPGALKKAKEKYQAFEITDLNIRFR